mgnify:CR=1 FL=1
MRFQMKKVIAVAVLAYAAGLCIGIAAIVKQLIDWVPLAASSFSIGLLIILNKKYMLFTGKVADSPFCPDKLAVMLLFNVLGARTIGAFFGVSVFVPNVPIWRALALAALCGFLVYIAVSSSSALITIAAVTAFVLLGCKHCIAEAALLPLNDIATWAYILLIAFGNSAGAWLGRGFDELRKRVLE